MGNQKSYQKITQSILNYLEQPSKFKYYDGLNMQLTKYSHIKSYIEVEKFVQLEYVVSSDLALLSIIADFSYCDARMLQDRLIEKKRKYPDVIYPSDDMDHLKNMLKRLCKASLVRGYSYGVENSNSTIIIYCITDAGVEIVKRFCCREQEVPVLNPLFPPHEMFKRLSANYISLALRTMNYIESYKLGRMEYVHGFGKEYIYSTLKGKRYDIDFNVIVEPVFFSVNRKMITDDDLNQSIEKRMKLLNKLITLPHYKNCYIVFVIEDKESLKRVINLAMKNLTNTKKEMVYFTGESIVYQAKDQDILLQISDTTDNGFRLIGGKNDFIE